MEKVERYLLLSMKEAFFTILRCFFIICLIFMLVSVCRSLSKIQKLENGYFTKTISSYVDRVYRIFRNIE